ncbi:MAG: hypothetical protein ACK5QH_19375 [Rubrivivax sp.]
MPTTLPLPAPPSTPAWPGPAGLLRLCWQHQRTLTLLALLWVVAMVPTALGLWLDSRQVHGLNVWIKPLKFMASLALFAATTALFIGLLPEARRRSRAVRFVVGSIVLAGVFEVAYITLQAALGQASHYNVSDRLHALLYQAMGVGALLLCATQAVLAVQIQRHGRTDVPAVWRQAVVHGLWLTLLLGAGAGMVLGGVQAPAGSGVPVVGWHASGDLRPAHFLGMHAQQLLPLFGWALSRLPAVSAPAQRRLVWLASALVVLAWAVLMAVGLNGAQPMPMPGHLR